jgi:hypothetical protein
MISPNELSQTHALPKKEDRKRHATFTVILNTALFDILGRSQATISDMASTIWFMPQVNRPCEIRT